MINSTTFSYQYSTYKLKPFYRYGFNGKEKDDEISGSGNSYDFGARLYDSRLGRWMTTDPLSIKYPYVTPYIFSLDNPIIYKDPDGKDVILVIWATTADGTIGHAGIAISNYIEKSYETVENGMSVTITEMVPDNTYTYYDNWPGPGTDGSYRSHDEGKGGVLISGVDDFKSNITELYPTYTDLDDNKYGIPLEQEIQDGVLKISTSYEQDQLIVEKLLQLNVTNPEYKTVQFNCAGYVSSGLVPLLLKNVGVERVLLLKTTTPNQLWKDAVKQAEKNNLSIEIIIDPEDKIEYNLKVNSLIIYQKDIKGKSNDGAQIEVDLEDFNPEENFEEEDYDGE